MIRLYNKTKYSGEVLKTILTYAQRKLGVKGDVVVKVNEQHRRLGSSGVAHNSWPYKWHLTKKRCSEKQRYTMIGKEQGWFEISLPSPKLIHTLKDRKKNLEITSAEYFYEIALHEMAHILDYRSYKSFKVERTPSGRRIAHDKRQIEISAENIIYDNKKKPSYKETKTEEVILLLAIEIEKKMGEIHG